MGLRIHQLPAIIANQIAAGEVIERPASVVKELLENAYDAGADAITIEIGYGGLNQIKISDNGSGIFAEDLPLALSAHATSKISKLDDLYSIDSMGFRGEALASIASIAKVSISSRPAHQEHAMMCTMQGANIHLSPCARAVGTTVDVSDLFFNAPVRKRFLKSEQLEFQAIDAVIKRFALSAPRIALQVKHNAKQVWTMPAALNEQAVIARMTQLFGSAFVKDAIYLDVERSGMRLYGWISGQSFQRSQNDRQWVYINQRMVKDKLINHALKQAYDGLLHPGRFPACLLYLIMDTSDVDVNVHPTKHEVRFAQPRLVHDFFTSQLTQALESIQKESETLPQWKEPEFTSAASIPMTLMKRTSIPNSADFSWVILNQKYALVWMQECPCVVDVTVLYYKYLLSQLQSTLLPLVNRPLLVPITYSMKNKEYPLPKLLSTLGIEVEEGAHELLIRSLPILFPYLDVRLFLDSIEKTHDEDVHALFDRLCQSQVFDVRLLSTDERMELNQFLLIAKDKEPFCKALTEENCRMFLDA